MVGLVVGLVAESRSQIGFPCMYSGGASWHLPLGRVLFRHPDLVSILTSVQFCANVLFPVLSFFILASMDNFQLCNYEVIH